MDTVPFTRSKFREFGRLPDTAGRLVELDPVIFSVPFSLASFLREALAGSRERRWRLPQGLSLTNAMGRAHSCHSLRSAVKRARSL